MRLCLTLAFFGLANFAHAQARDVRVEAFQNICVDQETFAAFGNAATTSGWTNVSPDAIEGLTPIVIAGRQAMAGAQFEAYENGDPSAKLYVLTSRANLPQVSIHGCGVYDFKVVDGLRTIDLQGIVSGEAVTGNDGGGNVALASAQYAKGRFFDQIDSRARDRRRRTCCGVGARSRGASRNLRPSTRWRLAAGFALPRYSAMPTAKAARGQIRHVHSR